MATKPWHLPVRLATGLYILNEGLTDGERGSARRALALQPSCRAGPPCLLSTWARLASVPALLHRDVRNPPAEGRRRGHNGPHGAEVGDGRWRSGGDSGSA
jgi:hypothetical protein